jgi:RND family efflux transporter MFP subunit
MDSPKPTLEDLRIERRDNPKPGIGIWPIVIGLLILALAAAGIWWFLRPKVIEVQTATARAISSNGSDRTVLNASGYVTARRAATASSKVTGKVVEVLIEEGKQVTKGQVLARLDDTNVKANLNVARAQLESTQKTVGETEAQLQQAESEFQRTVELNRQKIASQSELESAEATAKTRRARLARQQSDVTVAQRQVEMWEQQMDDLIIRAPFAGVVTTKDSQPGEMISPISAGGGFTRTGIGTIVDMESLEIEIDVNESFINRVAPGQPVEATLDAYPQWKIPCHVIAIIPTADRQKSTVKVRVGFDQLDPRILPEMAVKVAFRATGEPATTANSAVLIPKSAVRKQDGRDIVMLVQNGRAERRAVTVNSVTGAEAAIGVGVSAGDKVITGSPEGLTDGSKVRETRK